MRQASLPEIYVPTFEMKVNETSLPLTIAKRITQASVSARLDPPNQFSFQLNDPTLELINAQGGRFTEGSRVELSIGFVGNTRQMMVGEISALTADFPNSGPPTLQVDGFDLLHRLTRGTFYRKFEGATPNSGLPSSQVVSQIASEMNMSPSVDTTPARTEPWVQDNITNLKFVQKLAEASGYFLWVEADTLYFKKDPPVPEPNTVQLEWGKRLLSFSPRLSTAGQVNAVVVRGWDPVQKQSFSERASRSNTSTAQMAPTGQQQIAQGAGGKSELVITDAPVFSAQEAKTYAEQVLARQQQNALTGNGTAAGNPNIQVGTILQLTDIGRFEGKYVVEQVTHTLGGSGYQTSFSVRGQ